jgi:hypothetical protein
MRYEKHHLLWTKAEWTKNPLPKRVRQMSTFIIDIAYPNHRLLHASMYPPKVPERSVLREMEQLAVYGLSEVQTQIDHPLMRHIGHQLIIAAMDEDEVWERLEADKIEKFSL